MWMDDMPRTGGVLERGELEVPELLCEAYTT